MKELMEITANVIAISLEQDFLELKYNSGLDSFNYLKMLKSDVINTNLKKLLDPDRYIVHPFTRSAWEGRIVLDLKTNSLVSITSISNLNQISKKRTEEFLTICKLF